MTKKDSSSLSEIKSLDERLEKLQQADTGKPFQIVPPSETAGYAGMHDEDEDIYELSMDDIVYDEEEVEVEVEGEASDWEMEPAAAPVANVPPPVHHDPLSTLTLAELYEQQGFIPKALDIYRSILADDPVNAQLLAKISQLERQESAAKELSEQLETEDKADEPEPFESAVFEGMSAPVEAQGYSPLVHKQADNATGTLENWLENIRRIKACR